MGRQLQAGFTIIEVVLVMAITALLMLGMLANSTNRINDQHYREGVDSFRDFIAGSFEDVSSVKNDRMGVTERCQGISVGTSYTNIPTVTWRGGAPCFSVGKEIAINRSGDRTIATTRSVKASIDNTGTAVYSRSGVDDINKREMIIDWGVQARLPKPATHWPYNNYRLRLIKHPELGYTIFQFSTNGGTTWNEVTKDVDFCMSNPYDTNPSRWYVVRIAKDTVNATGVTTLNGENLCSR